MRPRFPPASGSPSVANDLDAGLLQDTQAYLECRFGHGTPRASWAEAWERFFQVCDPLVRRFARACRVSQADLDDCVQEVWAELVTLVRGRRYDPRRGRFRTWLYTIVHSKATDLLRRRLRHPTEGLGARAAALGSREGDPAAEGERRSQQEAVRRVLAALRRGVSGRSYRVLYLRWIEGWTTREVAAALGPTPAQVRSSHHRMRRKCRSLFDSCAGDGEAGMACGRAKGKKRKKLRNARNVCLSCADHNKAVDGPRGLVFGSYESKDRAPWRSSTANSALPTRPASPSSIIPGHRCRPPTTAVQFRCRRPRGW
jgi:RNA polymerase sigma-70 factor (ECF subfamily)